MHDEARAVGGDSVHLQVIGDNLRARIPLVERLLRSSAVYGALTSVLGDGYLLHPHHFVHEASTTDQSFHQDGNLPWNDRAHYRAHRPNWAMLFYYPQAVTLESGAHRGAARQPILDHQLREARRHLAPRRRGG